MSEPSPYFPYNPRHPVGTCAHCGGEMVFNVPRLGPKGGYVHKGTGLFNCGDRDPSIKFGLLYCSDEPQMSPEAGKPEVIGRTTGYTRRGQGNERANK